MRSLPIFVALAALAACNSSNGPRDEVLAAATIGAAGGQLEVTSGQYQGLLLTVPPGALSTDVVVQMVKPAPPQAGSLAPAVVGGPGPFVRIDPPSVDFLAPATLRLPYIVAAVLQSGPGNVRAMHLAAAGLRYLDPEVVDIATGRIEVHIESLGGFQVVQAPQRPLAEYLPALGTTVPLEDGHSFTYDQPNVPHMGTRSIVRWAIDTGVNQEAVYFESVQVAGRIDTTAGWQEVWDTPLDVLLHESNTLTPPAVTTTRIYSPVASPTPTLLGQVAVLGRFGFEVPLHIGGREFRDVLRIRLLTSWERADLGTGSSEQVFWFAPGVGLIQLQHDGVIRARTDL